MSTARGAGVTRRGHAVSAAGEAREPAGGYARGRWGRFTVSVRRGEMAIGLVLLVLACGVVWAALGMPAGTLGAPGPGFFPGVLGTLLALTSVGLIVRAVRLATSASGASVDLGHRDIALTTVALVVLSLVFEWLGYVLAATLFMLVLLRAFSRLGWAGSLAAAAAAAVLSYAFFVQLLGVSASARLAELRLKQASERKRRMLEFLARGFEIALAPNNLLYCFIGCLWGTIVGVLPGLGPLAGLTLLLPLTFKLDPASALIMLAGIFYGAMYGGSTTSILLRIPGEAASVVTCIDGHEMAKQGRAGPALVVAGVGSFIGGSVSVVGLMLFAPSLAAGDAARSARPPNSR